MVEATAELTADRKAVRKAGQKVAQLAPPRVVPKVHCLAAPMAGLKGQKKADRSVATKAVRMADTSVDGMVAKRAEGTAVQWVGH